MAPTIWLTGRLRGDADGVADSVAVADLNLGRLGRLALAYLVTERHRSVSRHELAQVLWGDELPATWESALRGALSRLRAALADSPVAATEVVRSEVGCYRLRLPPGVAVDVETARAAVEAAERDLPKSPESARVAARGAADVAAGQFLPGATGEWVERQQEGLSLLRGRALEVASRASSACARHSEALAAAAEAIAVNPLQESAHRCLISAHHRAGNRGAALRSYEDCRRMLADELGVPPSAETQAVYRRLLEDAPADAGHPAGSGPGRLPDDQTSFVGREAQLTQLGRVMATSRLLTLTGAGGVGKSRLAIHLAHDLISDRAVEAAEAWLVELADLTDPGLVPHHILSIVGVPEGAGRGPVDLLVAHFANRRALLVIDNCEHLLDAVSSVASAVLRAGPEVRIVATSREPLGVGGEVTWPVPPLATPDEAGAGAGPGDFDVLLASGATRLFCDRARAAAPDLDLRPWAREVAVICSRLEGMPLAIELAAARARTLAVDEIASRLDDHLGLLVGGPRAAPGRHQTLRATIDWSFEALSASEQTAFALLSVFAGGFTLEAARAVGSSGAADIVEDVSSLVDKSLISVDRGSHRIRYRMLETVRQYASGRLSGGGEEPAARDRHLEWMLDLAGVAEGGLEGADQEHWLSVVDEELANVRAAIDWAGRVDRAGDGLAIASALMRFWEVRGAYGDGRSAIEPLASQVSAPAGPRAKALNAAAVLAQRQGDTAAARRLYQESLVVRRALGDELGVATALHGLANLAVGDDDLVTARTHFEENLEIGLRLGQERMVAASLMNLGVVAQYAFMRGHRPVGEAGPEARSRYGEALAVYRKLGDRYGTAMALENLGAVERFIGDLARAWELHEESLAIRRALGDRQGIAGSARYLAGLAWAKGQIVTARQLHEERLAIERELGNAAQVAEASTDLGSLALAEGAHDEALERLEEARAIYEAHGDREFLPRVLVLLAELWRDKGDTARAGALATDAGSLAEASSNSYALSRALDLLGGLAAGTGDLAGATRLYAGADAARGGPPTSPHPGREADLAAARQALGPARFESAWVEGSAQAPRS